ncbi:MAG: pro-sigmaK processing inhibitor BofA family protein [Clostridia bacterium]|nr:pro-sigmaK processing inhibitor BofA family protein [Clostridia bacterium]
MFFDGSSVFAYGAGLLLVLVVCRIFIRPIKWMFKLLTSSLLGGLILAAVNFMGGFAGFCVTISPLAALFAGTLGVPGVLLVVFLQYLL